MILAKIPIIVITASISIKVKDFILLYFISKIIIAKYLTKYNKVAIFIHID